MTRAADGKAMSRNGLSGHQSARSKSVDWLTPPEWIVALGPFDLDPCASSLQPWRTAGLQWTSSGLDGPWGAFFVWCNPPYGPPKIIEPWMQRMAAHNNGIACVPARTETACWFKYVWPAASKILFVKGRPHFHKPVTGERAKANSGAPIALIAYGEKADLRLQTCGIAGQLISPRRQGESSPSLRDSAQGVHMSPSSTAANEGQRIPASGGVGQ